MLVKDGFEARLRDSGQWPLRAEGIEVLQVNLGWRCNQACHHCHVRAGPTRTESMARREIDAVLAVIRGARIATLDLTGGAPELNPDFEYLVSEARESGCHVMDRCNLTVLLEPGKEDLVSFLKDHQVEVVASLPFFQEEYVDRQRGPGVFSKSLEAMRRLNDAGYGIEESGLDLTLIYNPGGAFLPGSQAELESHFRDELARRHGVAFSRLYAMTNMPIGRFEDFLRRSGNQERYWQRLRTSFNPAAVSNVMCRLLVSVGWDGTLYDCDFNQVLGVALNSGLPSHIERFDYDALASRPIVTREHCFGCTAGRGSSCGGAILG